MEWLEVSVTTGNEAAEAVAEVLSHYARRGVVIEAGPEGWNVGPIVVRAYLPVDDQLPVNKHSVEKALGHLDQISPVSVPTFRSVAEEDWAKAWKERLTVMHIGQHIVIRPSWLDYVPVPDDVIIQLDPGMAFGTGLHPTTQMCLIELEELVRPEIKVLDMGTGSGILAIAAAKMGAGHVMALDNDPVAVKIARGNMITNDVQDGVSVSCGSLAEVSESYDLVVVNILANVIVEMLQKGLSARVRPGGKMIAAGIIDDQGHKVIKVMEQQGLTCVGKQQQEDWVCLIAERG
ncbi:MAG: 50S ribosomal protein L11 methyltransferase [Chloroflexi bacterium]|nr:50S ribosomal protein L11 methyltransferase [Chloroflexota bacterium]